MGSSDTKLPTKSSDADVDAFLRKVVATPPPATVGGEQGRLIFGMDATASREPTWDQASQIQGEMFSETETLGGIAVQLCYYRGFCEFEATPWLAKSDDLLKYMMGVTCAGGMTQIKRLLTHTIGEKRKSKVNALVFVGDCMEEDVDRLCHLAGQLGMLSVPAFVFQEGYDPMAKKAFREIARLSNGAYCPFDSNSPQQLHDLFGAVAVYAAGGRRALENYGKKSAIVSQLTHQLGKRTS